MRHLAHNIGLSTLALVLLFCHPARADEDTLVHFDLTLAGYRLGMTLQEASSIRPILLQQNILTGVGVDPRTNFEAFVDHVYLDEIEVNLWLHFREERLHKVVVRFVPEFYQDVAHLFSKALGPAKDQSRTLLGQKGGQAVRQDIYQWEYPTAKIYLVRRSDNRDFATVGMVAKETVGTEAVEKE